MEKNDETINGIKNEIKKSMKNLIIQIKNWGIQKRSQMKFDYY